MIDQQYDNNDFRDDSSNRMGETYSYYVYGFYKNFKTPDSETLSIVRNPFTDVSLSSSYFSKVAWAYNNKIVTGTTSTSFSPDNNCTRANFTVMLWKYAGKPDPGNAANPFTDTKNLTANEKTAILWAVKNNITSGTTSATFSPAQK